MALRVKPLGLRVWNSYFGCDKLKRDWVMSEFVNYNKRAVTLPHGCKNLLDVLKPHASVAPGLPGVLTEGTSSKITTVGKLADIESYCQSAFDSKFASKVLQVSSTDEAMSVVFCRWPRVELAAVTFRRNELWESTCRDLFKRHGLEQPKNFQWPKVAGVKVAPILSDHIFYKLIPTPSDALQFSQIAKDLFASLLKLTDDDALQFQHACY